MKVVLTLEATCAGVLGNGVRLSETCHVYLSLHPVPRWTRVCVEVPPLCIHGDVTVFVRSNEFSRAGAANGSYDVIMCVRHDGILAGGIAGCLV